MQIQYDGVQHYLGTFDTQEEAAIAYRTRAAAVGRLEDLALNDIIDIDKTSNLPSSSDSSNLSSSSNMYIRNSAAGVALDYKRSGTLSNETEEMDSPLISGTISRMSINGDMPTSELEHLFDFRNGTTDSYVSDSTAVEDDRRRGQSSRSTSHFDLDRSADNSNNLVRSVDTTEESGAIRNENNVVTIESSLLLRLSRIIREIVMVYQELEKVFREDLLRLSGKYSYSIPSPPHFSYQYNTERLKLLEEEKTQLLNELILLRETKHVRI